MRALSIKQPWAWAITSAGKDVENRTWATSYRGPFLIHAGVSRSDMDRDDLRALLDVLPPGGPDFGGIVGVAELTGCVSHSESKWFFGPRGFLLRNARPLAFVPCRGRLGFFTPPGEVVARLSGLL